MFGISHAVQNEKLWNLHTWYRVIVEVSVLGLLVVVCKISKQGVAMSKRRFGLGDLDCRTT